MVEPRLRDGSLKMGLAWGLIVAVAEIYLETVMDGVRNGLEGRADIGIDFGGGDEH